MAAEFLNEAFPSVRPEVREGTLSHSDAASIAIRYVQARWESVHCALMFGSTVTGEFGPYSDIDIMVYLSEVTGHTITREIFEGVPIEAHMIDEKAFAQELRQAEITGIPNNAFVVLDGVILIDTSGSAERFRNAARNLFQRGPLPLQSTAEDYVSRNISKKILNLLTTNTPEERQIVGATLKELLFYAHFVRLGTWRYTGKWAARMAPEFAERLGEAVRIAELSHETNDLIELAREELSQIGGFRWSDRNIT